MLKGVSEVCGWNMTFRHLSFSEIILQMKKHNTCTIFIPLNQISSYGCKDKIIYTTDKLSTEEKTLTNNRLCHMNAIHTTGIIHNCNVILIIKGSSICTKKKVNNQIVFLNKKCRYSLYLEQLIILKENNLGYKLGPC